MTSFLLFVLSLLSFAFCCEVLRHTQYGPICGTLKKSRELNSNVTYHYFTGVPYARSPIGDLRFKEALPPIPWTTPRDATVQGDACIQKTDLFMGNSVVGSEDCLTLEIAVPVNITRQCPSELPVMVWIHGGSFILSSYKDTGPDYLMKRCVILVAINYRLSVLGFLSTLNDDAPGNLGLKDQTAALLWIKYNIANFGGNPNKVTIFGGSAGGASVQFHQISSKSKGLFHRAISQSGVTLNTWVFQRYPKEMAFRLGRGVGIDTANTTELIEKLRNIPADVLVMTGFNKSIMGDYTLFDEVPFLPSIEHQSPSAFISERAYALLKRGQFNRVPYLIGHTTEEGSFAYDYIAANYIDINIYQQDPSLFVPISMNIPKGDPRISNVVTAIKNFFFMDTPFTNKFNWIKFMSQDVRGVRKAADLICQRQRKNVFFYIFSYVGTNSLGYLGRAGHYSDVLKLLYPDNPFLSKNMTERDLVVQERLLDLWTNFAYYGIPSENYPNYCSRQRYLEIGNDLIFKSNPDARVYIFWLNLFLDYAIKPFNTF